MLNLNSPRLIITPQQNDFFISDTSAFIADLMSLKFLGSKFESPEQTPCFDIGEDFLHQVSFLGCSPTLYSDNTDNDIFISLSQQNNICFAHSASMPPPRCPHCQKTDKDWSLYYQHWIKNNAAVNNCRQCGKAFNFTQMKWKRNGGYGKLFIQIHGIQEQLAVPNPSFINNLQAITETSWEYFFAIK